MIQLRVRHIRGQRLSLLEFRELEASALVPHVVSPFAFNVTNNGHRETCKRRSTVALRSAARGGPVSLRLSRIDIE